MELLDDVVTMMMHIITFKRGGRHRVVVVWQENSGQSSYWQLAPLSTILMLMPKPFPDATLNFVGIRKSRMFVEPSPAVYQSSATDPIWLIFLLLPRFFDPKNRSQPLSFVQMSGPQL